MATNKTPWAKCLGGDIVPFRVHLPVAVGSTQAIKRGEICTYDWTTDVAAPATAGDGNLVICDREQKADDVARMIEFIVPRPDDVFEFALDAAQTLRLGDTFAISDSQTLTSSASNICARQAGDDNVPNPSELSTTRRSKSYAEVCFDESASYWAAINGNS